ncbi:MAG: DUF5119 domain-containing protein [Duncaniella sp.]|uniref:DUF5119 domain-containing protein n=1 Tax=Duncaniella sp. TaxID=2518496 RepID=UPI0023D225BE|nr:DUF5119 domain-containing protein [Duncaniella sp.]MDE5988038.1 DUF5119 domain-containing protein [Duncaniella sp.]
MKILNCLKTLTAAAAISLGFSSCDHKPLCYTHPHYAEVRVEFDWSENTSGTIPEMMSVYAYPRETGGPYVRFDIDAVEGGTIELPVGEWDFLTVNPTSSYIQFRGHETHSTFEAFTREANPMEWLSRSSRAIPRAKGAEDENVRIAPDELWHQTLRNFRIEEGVHSYSVVFTPTDPLSNYTVEIRNIENLRHVLKISGTISGLGESMLLTNRTHMGAPVTMPYPTDKVDEKTVISRFRTFGRHTDAKAHKIMVYCIMADGKQYYTEADATQQVVGAPDPRNVHIILDGLDLPKPIEGGSGLDVDINDWNEIEIDIILPGIND